MKKYSKNGFVLAETLVVTVFLMIIFSMIYSSFYPLLGEYEKREAYDDIDSKYAVYWIKKIIEDGSYKIVQYFGLLTGEKNMNKDGWFKGTYFAEKITADYPILNLDDFTSDNGFTLREKTEEEKIIEKIKSYKVWAPALERGIRLHKAVLTSCGLEKLPLMCKSFSELIEKAFIGMKNLPIDGTQMTDVLQQEITAIHTILSSIYSLKVDGFGKAFETDYKYFYIMFK